VLEQCWRWLGRKVEMKVPLATALFWVLKVTSTGLGESASDALNHRFDPVVVVPLSTLALGVLLAVQVVAARYATLRYWVAVFAVAVVGTMAADALHKGVGVSYAVSTVFYAVVLAIVLLCWWKVEGTLSIHSITTRRRECFYWAVVLATFALGTAAGDLTATTLGIGFGASIWLFAGLLALPGLAYRFLGLGGVAAFWSAYVLTRPLGASIADYLAVPAARGGLGWTYATVTWVGMAVAAVLLALQFRADQRTRR